MKPVIIPLSKINLYSNLPKELAKKVLKTNIGGYISYLGTAITLGVAAFSAVKIKDHFAAKRQAKNN